MNNDLISRDDIWELLNAEHPLGFNNDDIADAFRNAPAVDAVEVVRCKDCRYFMEYRKRTETADGDCRTKMTDDADHLLCLPVKYSDFCSRGREKR